MDFGILSHSVPPRATMHHSSSSTSSLSRTISYFHRRTSSPPASSISRFLRVRSPTLPSSSVVRIPTVRHCHDYRNDASSETDLPILEFDGGGRQSVSHAFEVAKESDLRSIWKQIKQILLFAGPATGLWICGPLMSLIDTVVIGQSSTLELAALGPGTVVCDYLGYLFMFLSISTSNMVATALARKDKDLAQHQISMLLFIALSCGVGMFIFTKFLGMPILSGFIGLKNEHMIPAANTYVQIRSFAWPAILVGMVAQSASLGMKDSWGPLKALAVASAVNCLGDIILCSVFGFGISGAAWATAVSQIVAAFMMIQTLKQTGFVAFSLHAPSGAELLQIIKLAAPVFLITTSKIVFYTILTYFATAMGTITVAAHQVMVNLFLMCALWGEPLSQSAQSFMPEMIYGVNHSLKKARMLLKSLLMIGALTGLISGAIGTSVAWLHPSIFTTDSMIIKEMHKVLIPSFVALMVTPSTLCFEGTLLAGRELGFLSLSMSGCLCLGGFLMFFCSRVGLAGCWWVFAGFQWTRFLLALLRLASPHGMLYSEEFYTDKSEMVRAT